MAVPTSKESVALERMYNDLNIRAKRLISAVQIHPDEMRYVLNTYAAIIEEARHFPDLHARFQEDFSELSIQLKIRARTDSLYSLQNSIILMGLISYPPDASQLQLAQAQLGPRQYRELPPTHDIPIEARVTEYKGQVKGQVDSELMEKIKPFQGRYLKVAEICKIGGYNFAKFYDGIRGKEIPKQDGKYLLDESTIAIFFGSVGSRKHNFQRDDSLTAKVADSKGQIDSEIMTRIQPLQDTYVSVDKICEIAGYHFTTFYGRIKGKDVPKQGKRNKGVKYLINEDTIPIIFGNIHVGRERTQLNESHATSTRNKKFYITRNSRVFQKSSSYMDKRTIITSKKSSAKTIMPTASGDILTFEQMEKYFSAQFGHKGKDIMVEILQEHGDNIQKGQDKFSKATLDEIIKSPPYQV